MGYSLPLHRLPPHYMTPEGPSKICSGCNALWETPYMTPPPKAGPQKTKARPEHTKPVSGSCRGAAQGDLSVDRGAGGHPQRFQALFSRTGWVRYWPLARKWTVVVCSTIMRLKAAFFWGCRHHIFLKAGRLHSLPLSTREFNAYHRAQSSCETSPGHGGDTCSLCLPEKEGQVPRSPTPDLISEFPPK